MEEVDLDASAHSEFDALSYTWFIDDDVGPPAKGTMRTVVCNGMALDVHQNLYNALLQLRELRRPLPIWVDAICINQDDDDEKTAQVRMMGEIFGQAQTVVVWLGRKMLATDVALSLLRPTLLAAPAEALPKMLALADRAYSQGWSVNRMKAIIHAFVLWPSLSYLLGRGFFERVWTLQEVILARNVVYYIGDELVPIQNLVDCNQHKDITHNQDNSLRRESFGSKQGTILRGILFMHRTRDAFLRGIRCPLERSIWEARRRKTTKPADKVFAILSMSDSTVHGPTLRANYRKRVDKVYCECARALLDSPTGLHVLSLVGQLRHGAQTHTRFPSVSTRDLLDGVTFVPGLPSWVPDLSAQARPIPLRDLHESVRFAAATPLAPRFEVAEADGAHRLVLRAAIVDTVRHTGDCSDTTFWQTPWMFVALPITLGPTYAATGEPVIAAFWKTLVAGETQIASRFTFGDVTIDGAHFAEWFAAFADTRRGAAFTLQDVLAEHDVAFTPQELAVDLARLPDAMRTRNSWYTAAERGAQEKYKALVIRRFLAMYDGPAYGLRARMEERLNGHLAETGWAAAASTKGFGLRPTDALAPSPYQVLFEKFYLHRCLFTTQTGYMGLGPWTVQTGDVVALVAGAAVPYLLRPSTATPGCWELVGECYCHGMMGGEDTSGAKLPGLNLNDLHFETVTLV